MPVLSFRPWISKFWYLAADSGLICTYNTVSNMHRSCTQTGNTHV